MPRASERRHGVDVAVRVPGGADLPRSARGLPCRYHLHESVIQREVTAAARSAGITKVVGPHVLRHGYASHLLQRGYDGRTVQELPGHADVATTMTYLHALNKGGLGVRSPLDRSRARCRWAIGCELSQPIASGCDGAPGAWLRNVRSQGAGPQPTPVARAPLSIARTLAPSTCGGIRCDVATVGCEARCSQLRNP